MYADENNPIKKGELMMPEGEARTAGMISLGTPVSSDRVGHSAAMECGPHVSR